MLMKPRLGLRRMAILTFLSEITTVSASENCVEDCAEEYCSQSNFLVIKVVQMTIVKDHLKKKVTTPCMARCSGCVIVVNITKY